MAQWNNHFCPDNIRLFLHHQCWVAANRRCRSVHQRRVKLNRNMKDLILYCGGCHTLKTFHPFPFPEFSQPFLYNVWLSSSKRRELPRLKKEEIQADDLQLKSHIYNFVETLNQKLESVCVVEWKCFVFYNEVNPELRYSCKIFRLKLDYIV